MKWRFAVPLLFAAMSHPSPAQLDEILGRLGVRSGVDQSKAASGLKEALRIGTDKAVNLTGRTDGYFANQAIKILLPEKLRLAERGLRLAGAGPQIDEFVLSMNRAAEKAAPAARGIFKDALLQMTFDDARRILTGGDTAATDYFRAKTSTQLAAAFRPTVESAMAQTGVVSKYNQLTGGLSSLPFSRGQSLNINDYVVGKALDGLFYMLGQEEKKIRTDPAAQVTPLLKEVFGKH